LDSKNRTRPTSTSDQGTLPDVPANIHAVIDGGELQRLLIESVVDYAIFVLDPDGNILTWNLGAERLKGYTDDEIIGRHFSIFYPQDDVRAGKPAWELQSAVESGRVEDEGWRVRKDGSLFWANVVITALKDEHGNLLGFAKITRDLTARRDAEEQARMLAAERGARDEAVRRSEELARLTDELQQQALELESQTEEAQSLAEELEQANEQLQTTVGEAEEAREAALSAERFVRGIIASISDPLIVNDSNWRVRYVNPAAVELLERVRKTKAGDLSGQRLFDIYPRLRGTIYERQMFHAATARTPTAAQAYNAERGEWWEMSCYPLPDGGLATQWTNITESKRSEESSRFLARASEILSASLDYERTLAELAHIVVPELADWCAVDILGEDGQLRQLAVAHVDPAKVRLARALTERYPPDPNAATGVPNVLRTGEPEIYTEISDELLVASAVDDEHLRIIRELGLKSALIVPLVARGHTLGALSLLSAESRRRYREADLALANELARRAALAVDNARLHRAALAARDAAQLANEAKSRFLAVMSHEFRTPLNAIAGYAELLRMGLRGPVTSEQVQDLDRIAQSERTLLSLINDILNYARLEGGHVQYATRDLRVQTVIAELEALVLPQLHAKRLHFEFAKCDPELIVHADAEKVRQILLNLLSNAIKFTDAGGSIGVECEESENHVRILVRDTGVGIPGDKLQAIFEPFVQLDRSLTSAHEGSGLGLAISRDLARGMRGDLTAESAPGRGSTFILTLPRRAQP
jgi:PAS domain S-box-containing protein